MILLSVSLMSASCEKQSDTPKSLRDDQRVKAAPIDLSEPVSLNDQNPHYFTFRGAPTILITSGEHYGSVINLDFDYIPYLDELQSKGFNCTRLFGGPYVEFAGWYGYDADQPLSPAPSRFICPWARSSKAGYVNGGNKFDLTKWDQHYFDRLKDFMEEAGKRGVVVELTLFSPYYNSPGNDVDRMWKYSPFYEGNNINGIGTVPRPRVLTINNGNLLAVQDAYVEKLVTELRDFDNLIFEICNEPYIQDLVTYDWMNHISEVIRNTESGSGKIHLISQNIANGAREITDAVPNVSVFNFHYSYPSAVDLNYDLNKVIGNNETDGFTPAIPARVKAWEFILGGGGLFNNLDMSFTPATPDGGSEDSESAVLRSMISTLKQFIDSFDFINMQPDMDVISDLDRNDYSTRALSETGVSYAIYLRKTDLDDKAVRRAVLDLDLPAGKYMAMWIDPATGNVLENEMFSHSGGVMAITSPAFTSDFAVAVRKKDVMERLGEASSFE